MLLFMFPRPKVAMNVVFGSIMDYFWEIEFLVIISSNLKSLDEFKE